MSKQRHPGGEQDRQAEDRVERQPAGRAPRRRGRAGRPRWRCRTRGRTAPERVHLPRLLHRPGRPPVEAVQESARIELALELLLVERRPAACAGRSRTMPTRTIRFRIPISEQERARDDGPDQPGRLVQRRAVVRRPRRSGRGCRTRRAIAEQEDDRRVAEREEEADAQRALAVVHQPAGRVVDRPMWSASKACRMPSVYAVMPTPSPKAPSCRGGARAAARARRAGRSRPRAGRRSPRRAARRAAIRPSSTPLRHGASATLPAPLSVTRSSSTPLRFGVTAARCRARYRSSIRPGPRERFDGPIAAARTA